MAVVFQRGQTGAGRRVVQKLQRLAQRRQLARHGAGRQQFLQRRALHRGRHGLAQIGLRQAGAGRVDGGQALRQRRVLIHRLEGRVHHLAAEEAHAQLAAHAQPGAYGHGFLVRGIEVQEAQQQRFAVVLDAHDQLAPAAQLDTAFADHAFALQRVALTAAANRHDARLVLVAQRDVQRQVDVAQQAEFLHRLLRRGLRLGCSGRRGGCLRHGRHCAASASLQPRASRSRASRTQAVASCSSSAHIRK